MKKNDHLLQGVLITVALGVALPASAADDANADLPAKVLDKVKVISDPANIQDLPGSAHVITTEDIRGQSYDDINRVLRKAPGVYVREEDGYGLFPNISLRGVDTTRTSKVTVMEDGILMAPAPYSAPSAYYSPTVGRMSGVEILMGSSQIKYGPHITGGVLNYLSTEIPDDETIYLKSIMGSYGELRTHAYVGNTFDTEAGKFGVLLEAYNRKTDGFKDIDETPDFRDGDDTGFTKTDYTIKLSWEPNTSIYQRLEFRYGESELDADETYLGLSEVDFKEDPYRRYAASRFDNIETEQDRTYLRYTISPTDNLDIITTAYRNTFDRNWYKLKDLRGLPSSTRSLSAALAGADNGSGLACLKGEGACTLRVRANNRSYEAKGIESVGYYRFATGTVEHEIAAGLRYHEDNIRRFQWDDDYTQAANGTITGMTPGTPGGAGDRFQETEALAMFIQDTIKAGAWTFTPGIRYEQLDQISEDPKDTLQSTHSRSGRDGKNDFDMTAGGMGVSYEFSEMWTGFGGVHRGFSPPSPRSTRSGLDPETSTAYELGARYTNNQQALAAQAVLFYTDYEDLIVADNIGGTGSGNTENFGEVEAYGLEFALQYDAGIANDWALKMPSFISLTYTHAEQQNDARSEDAESIFSFGEKGNDVPYIPEFQITVGTGIESTNWGAFISGSYVDETYTSANNVDDQIDGAGDPDSRFGKTDSYFVADVAAYYEVKEGVKLLGGVQNLFDKEYLVSRQPHGPRPGMPRFVYVGIELDL